MSTPATPDPIARTPFAAFALRHVLTIVILAWMVAFWISISRMSVEAAGYPRVILLLLAVFLLVALIRDLVVLVRDRALRYEEPYDEVDLKEAAIASGRRGFLAWWYVWDATILVGVLSVLYINGIQWIGFYWVTPVYVAATLLLLKVRSIWTIILVSLGTALGTWLLFGLALSVRL